MAISSGAHSRSNAASASIFVLRDRVAATVPDVATTALSNTAPGYGRARYVAPVSDRLLFVTQVAPYPDGPAGVHGVLDQAAVGVGQVAELHGLRPQRVDDVRDAHRSTRSATRARSRCSRSARRRGAPSSSTAILEQVRAGRLAICAIHSATDSCYGWDEYGALVGARFDGHPWTQTFVADVLDPTHPACAHLGAEWTLARRGVPVPRPAPRRAGAAARARR